MTVIMGDSDAHLCFMLFLDNYVQKKKKEKKRKEKRRRVVRNIVWDIWRDINRHFFRDFFKEDLVNNWELLWFNLERVVHNLRKYTYLEIICRENWTDFQVL